MEWASHKLDGNIFPEKNDVVTEYLIFGSENIQNVIFQSAFIFLEIQ